MRYIFMIGGFTGFALTSITGALADREPDLILRDSALACIAGGLLFRWFWSVIIKALSEALAAKRAAQAEAEAAEQAKAK